MSGPKSAQMVLQNPTVDTAVFEVARGGILREGLGYDRNDVAVVTNVTGDHLGPRRDRLDRPARQRRRASSSRRCRGPAPPSSTPTIRTSPGWAATAPAGSCYFSCDGEGQGRLRPGRRSPRPGRRGVRDRADRRGRSHRPPARVPDDAGAVHPPDPGDVRRAGPDERGERAGGGRRGVGGRRPPARHPAGPADVLDVVLPGAGPAQPARGRRGPRRHRLLPQRRRDAPAGRLRRADGQRARGPRRAARRPDRDERTRPRAGRAIGVIGIPGDRRDEDQQRVRRDRRHAPSTRSSSARTSNLRGRQPGETATNVLAGVKRATGIRRCPDGQVREDPRRDDRRPGGAPPGRSRATSS